MYFKKRYCHCCGNILNRKRTERIIYKGDPEHKAYCTISGKYKPYGDILVIGKAYYCLLCNKYFSCDAQGEIIKAQKYYKKHIVTKEEIMTVYNMEMQICLRNILKLRWILSIPVVGAIICLFYIFSGKLNIYTEDRDAIKLVLSSVLLFAVMALIIKFVLLFFNNIDFINNYTHWFMLIPSLFTVNIPTLWYINHNFKNE